MERTTMKSTLTLLALLTPFFATPAIAYEADAPQNPVIGEWRRELPKKLGTIDIKFSAERFTLVVKVDPPDAKGPSTLTVTGCYSLNRRGSIYGIITGVDVDLKDGKDFDFKEHTLLQHNLIDAPVGMSYTLDVGVLTLNKIRIGTADLGPGYNELSILGAGAYKRREDGKAGTGASVIRGLPPATVREVCPECSKVPRVQPVPADAEMIPRPIQRSYLPPQEIPAPKNRETRELPR
jgi:hypothetical protein